MTTCTVLYSIAWVALLAAPAATGFNVHSFSSSGNQRKNLSPRALFALSVDESTPRNLEMLDAWANHFGVLREHGFTLQENTVYEGDWSATTTEPVQPRNRLVHVPANLILNSKQAREEMPGADRIMQAFVQRGSVTTIPQFFLFVKILREYERGEDSPWYYWLDSLPRKFNTAVCLDDFEMRCLPPFLESLAKIDRINFANFMDVLTIVDAVSPQTQNNLDVLKWAFNVVFTRCWGRKDAEMDIVPMADMFNHGYPEDVIVDYDAEGNVNVIATQNVQPGQTIRLSYGQPTNPTRLFSTFGFLDNSSPATFCKIMALRPSQELINMGYDFAKLVFYVEDGAIAEEVWDVMLYTVLAEVPEMRQALYQAHMNGDRNTKKAIHDQYFLETCKGLLNHVDTTLEELVRLKAMMEQEGADGHPRLPMIYHHNNFVAETFTKVKNRLDGMVASEVQRRQQAAAY